MNWTEFRKKRMWQIRLLSSCVAIVR